MLILLSVVSGLLLGGQLACLWGLRKANRVWPEGLLAALVLLPIAYFWGESAWGWPTPGSIAKDSGLLTRFVDRALFVGITIGTAVVVIAVLVRSGVTRRLERWSSASEGPVQSTLRPRPTTEPRPPSGSGPGVPPPR